MRANKFNRWRGCIIFGFLVFVACLTVVAQERRALKLSGSEGLPFSDGVIAGDTLYVAGQEGTDEKGKLAAGGTSAETQAALANIENIVKQAGFELKDIVSVTVYLADIHDFAEMNKVYKNVMPDPKPARATVQAAARVNNARIEMKLEEQEKLLLEARLDALQSQINPHFLFNTLNSISSLVRFDPDKARDLIVKLSKILRRLLGKHDEFVQLREEVEFIDDYLDIEVARFGREKLRVYKHLDPETLDIVIPSMLLQPLVENSIKHGLAPKVDGGSITLRSRIQDNKLVIQVEDDGVGMSAPPAVAAHKRGSGRGIGMINVAERLHVLFGDDGKMVVQSRDNQGTLVVLELPVLQQDITNGSASSVYALRSNTRS